MTRRAAAESLFLPFQAAPAPESSTRAVEADRRPRAFRFVSRRPGCDDVVIYVPVRYEGQGAWPNGLPAQIIEQDDAARDRAIQRHAERVAAEARGGARGAAVDAEQPECPKVNAKRLRALLAGATGPMGHHDVAKALGVSPEAATQALTNLRVVAHVHQEPLTCTTLVHHSADRKRPHGIGGS